MLQFQQVIVSVSKGTCTTVESWEGGESPSYSPYVLFNHKLTLLASTNFLVSVFKKAKHSAA